ncbi:MAG: hypothetical protein KF866_03225 [Phycisphaeraceae bacterium]|nr:hypothetical protein [Phycisphaeraceae bacterium]MCW5753291.1 hypothetical protein [Phycisphaeraceae bacterium]
MYDRLLEAARRGGWPAVYTVFAQGETVIDRGGLGGVCERPARRATLNEFLAKRSDLAALLDNAAQERRDRLLENLQDEVEQIALGPGDVTQDFDDKGRLKRTRIDRRNKLHALLKLLAAHDPDTYAERRKLDVAGQVNHAHAHLSLGNAPGGYVVDMDSVAALEPGEQAELFRLLTKIEDARRALPPGDSNQ